jgi:hypothetical protein
LSAKFEVFMAADGSYIHMTGRDRYKSGVALGVSTVDYFTPSPLIVSPNGRGASGGISESGWWIAKYGNQPAVDIYCLSDAGRYLLMQRFGIQLREQRKNLPNSFVCVFHGSLDWVIYGSF